MDQAGGARYPRSEKTGKGQGAVLLCAILWSTSGLFIKLVNWNPVVIAGTRSLIAAAFLLALRLLRRRPLGEVRLPGRVFRGDSFFTLTGGLAYAVTMIAFVIANKHTASANAILLQYTAPVWAAILGWLIAREKPRGEHWAALGLVLFGMFLFFRDSLGRGGFLGDILAVVSGISFGAHSALLRMIKRGDTAEAMLFAHIACFLFSIPFLFIYPPGLSPAPLLAILFMGTVQIGAASALFAYGIKRISAVEAMLTAM
ncbi:MAG: DMT family transporter, partial [Spirochaetaceae bacterium]|nr:DMT family transporter [Spirochaetaceae bacterium]